MSYRKYRNIYTGQVISIDHVERLVDFDEIEIFYVTDDGMRLPDFEIQKFYVPVEQYSEGLADKD